MSVLRDLELDQLMGVDVCDEFENCPRAFEDSYHMLLQPF